MGTILGVKYIHTYRTPTWTLSDFYCARTTREAAKASLYPRHPSNVTSHAQWDQWSPATVALVKLTAGKRPVPS